MRYQICGMVRERISNVLWRRLLQWLCELVQRPRLLRWLQRVGRLRERSTQCVYNNIDKSLRRTAHVPQRDHAEGICKIFAHVAQKLIGAHM